MEVERRGGEESGIPLFVFYSLHFSFLETICSIYIEGVEPTWSEDWDGGGGRDFVCI